MKIRRRKIFPQIFLCIFRLFWRKQKENRSTCAPLKESLTQEILHISCEARIEQQHNQQPSRNNNKKKIRKLSFSSGFI